MEPPQEGQQLQDDLLTMDEMQRIILNFLGGRPDGAATRAEIETVMRWARQARIEAGLLRLTLEGTVTVGLRGGQISFTRTKVPREPPGEVQK